MNRNANSIFAYAPHASVLRSVLPRDSSVKFTGNIGQVIPFYVDEVLPGDTMKIETSKVIRLQTMVTPMMDNLFADIYWFYVPMRLTWEHAKEFFGENTQSPWIQQTDYVIPQITAPSGGWNVGTIADYMGIPTGVGNISVSALPFRAYALIMEEFFRSEAVQNPLVINKTDATVVGSNGSSQVTDIVLGGSPFIANKTFDYFSGCLPSPQKGPSVVIPVGQDYQLPVYPLNELVPDANKSNSMYPLLYKGKQGGNTRQGFDMYNANASPYTPTPNWISNDSDGNVPDPPGLGKISGTSNYITPINLWAIGSGAVGAASINQLRTAFAVQKFFERWSMAGSRYTETILAMFGVSSPDSRLQRPEYLGGNRININVNQIIQQSETATTPQGTPTGLSLTCDKHFDVNKSFVEHGFLIGLCVLRYKHSYQQGIDAFWSRKTKFDFYWPLFQNLGNKAVLNKEIYAQGSSVLNPNTNKPYDDEVFGYQEAWSEYRYKPDRVAGEMRSQYATSLDIWHLADDYNAMPTLSADWLREDKSNVDRVLAVTSSVANQFFADFYIKNTSIRPMPVHSVPGLIDHH